MGSQSGSNRSYTRSGSGPESSSLPSKAAFSRTFDRNRRVIRLVQLHDPIALRQLLPLTARSIAHRIDPVLDLAIHVEVVGVVRSGHEENERFLGHKPHIQVQKRVRLHVRNAHRQPALRRTERHRLRDQRLQEHLVYAKNGEMGKLRGCRGNWRDWRHTTMLSLIPSPPYLSWKRGKSSTPCRGAYCGGRCRGSAIERRRESAEDGSSVANNRDSLRIG